MDLECMSGDTRGAHEGGGAPWARPLPREHPGGPPMYPLHPYIPTYPQTTRYGAKNIIPLPQPFVPMRSHLGAFSGALPEGASITEGFYIYTIPFR